jgi:hypothetical protein
MSMRRAAPLLALAAFAACVSIDTTTPETSDIAGAYSLRSINGQALPFVLGINGSDSLSLIDDTYTLTGDARFSEVFHTRRVQSGTIALVAGNDSGTFTRSGQSLRMVGLNGPFTATIKTDTVQLDAQTTTCVFRT